MFQDGIPWCCDLFSVYKSGELRIVHVCCACADLLFLEKLHPPDSIYTTVKHICLVLCKSNVPSCAYCLKMLKVSFDEYIIGELQRQPKK